MDENENQINNDKTINNDQIPDSELLKQLNILNISYNGLLMILFAIFLNIQYVGGERTKVLDKLNNTNISECLPDLNDLRKISNEIFLFVTTIFLFINYDGYETALENEASPKEQRIAFKSFISTFLVLVATSISKTNLEV